MGKPMVLPTFLYIGAAKAGSSWIFEALKEHPDVFVPAAKDIQFFDAAYDRGLEWYGTFFRAGSGAALRGELSHNYFTSSVFAERIAHDLPGIKLICCLREPFDRTVSAYIHAIALGTASDRDFREFCSRDSIIRAASYFENLHPFYARFPREDILVLFYDDLVEDSEAFISAIFNHIGADPDFTPRCVNRRVLGRRAARSLPFAGLAYGVGRFLRNHGFANLVGHVKRSRIFTTVMYRPSHSRPAIPEDIKAGLRDRFRAQYDDLESVIGRSLPLSWRGSPPR